MPKRCTKFVTEFLIPSLDTKRFGEHLKWIDRKKSVFQIEWCHKGGPTWTEVEAEVFVEWDKIKGHYQPEDKQYYTKSKQRFRSLLYKLTLEGQIKQLECADKFKKVYSIGEKKLRKRKNSKALSVRSSLSSSDSISSNEKDVSIEEIKSSEDKDGSCEEEMWGISCDNMRANELRDHNYSSLSNSVHAPSDCEDHALDYYEDNAFPLSLYDWSENSEKKVLTERNPPYNTQDEVLYGDLQMGMKDLTLTRLGDRSLYDSIYDQALGYLWKNIENKLPVEIFETNQQDPESSEIFDSSSLNVDDLLAGMNSEEFPSFLKLLQ